MNLKKTILDALGIYKSMAASGESPSDATNVSFDEAVKAVKSLDEEAIEAMQAVDVINGDLDTHYHDLGYHYNAPGEKGEQLPTPSLTFSYSGTCASVDFDGWPIWDNQNDPREWPEDDGDREALEPFFRKQIAKRLQVMREMPF